MNYKRCGFLFHLLYLFSFIQHFYLNTLTSTTLSIYSSSFKMKFTTAIIALVGFISSTEACQCLSDSGPNNAATEKCCREVNGKPTGDQCPAGDIAQDLSKFASCCRRFGDLSDCNCPIGCGVAQFKAQREAMGASPPTDEEIAAVIAHANQ